MKSLAFIAALCLVTVLALGQSRRLLIAPATPSGALLINENFEGAGTPSPWVADPTAPDFDNTVSPLSGSQDLLKSVTTDGGAHAPFTASSEVWMQCEFKFSFLPGSSAPFVWWFDSTQTPFVNALIASTGEIGFSASAGGGGSTTVDQVEANIKYWLFFHYKKGTGANAIYELEFNTTSTRTGTGNKYTIYNSGAVTFDAAYVYLYITAAQWSPGNTIQFDNVKVSNTGWPP